MRKDLILTTNNIYSSFLSCPKDTQILLQKLFVQSRPFSDRLKKLLIINNPDCLTANKQEYQKLIDDYNISKLIEKGYIRLNPKIIRGTHEEIKSYIILSFDNFSPNRVSERYLDYTVHFDIVCYNDAWVLNNLEVRPLMICGYIDGILNNAKLSGIGTLHFMGCKKVVLDEKLSGYTLMYEATHGSDDWIADGAI